MTHVKINATIPFPLRVDPEAYAVADQENQWSLRVERVQRDSPDERLMGAGSTVDLREDREGQAAYSRVNGDADIPDDVDPVWSFTRALSSLIEHTRDVLDVTWIRRVEPVDLLSCEVMIGGEVTTRFGVGRTGGMQLPTVGLTEQADRRLRDALNAGGYVPTWRLMQLDALDALKTGRYEDACVLIWSAVESAGRTALPGAAHARGLGAGELDDLLQVNGRRRNPSRSLEEATERAAALDVLRQTAELVPGVGYEAHSLVEGLRGANRLRNRIVHQGVRLSYADALREIEAVNFYLRQVPLREVQPPPPLLSWESSFGEAPEEIRELAEVDGLRIVLANTRGSGLVSSWWDPERIARELWLRVDSQMPTAVIAALARSTVGAWRLRASRTRPRLRATREASRFLIAGMLQIEADYTTFAVARYERLRAEPNAAAAAEYWLSEHVRRLTDDDSPRLSRDDVRVVTAAADLACFTALIPEDRWDEVLSPLVEKNPAVESVTRNWAEALRGAGDEHGVCDVLRRIHATSPVPWLDSIVVDCPIEQISCGSAPWPLGQPA